ncbi:HAD family phosphatase [Candidatus Woesearchaeota archaeon]|nr:HAD family phosphatase [Candidatus Woesearchaeota archaeon]
MIKIVFSDVDKTLMFDDGIEEKTKELIELINQEVPVVLCTGRREERYQQIKDLIPHTHAIYESGGIIRVAGKIDEEWDKYMEQFSSYLEEAEKQIDYKAEWKKHSFVIKVKENNIPSEEMKEIRNRNLEGVTIRLSQGGRFIDVFPEKGGKDNAINYLCTKLNIPLDCTVAIGDDDNDIDMFRVASELYTIDSATTEIKQLVHRRGGYVSSYGFHEGVQDVLGRIYKTIFTKP